MKTYSFSCCPAIFVNLHYDEITIFLDASFLGSSDKHKAKVGLNQGLWPVSSDQVQLLDSSYHEFKSSKKYRDFIITDIDENCRTTKMKITQNRPG